MSKKTTITTTVPQEILAEIKALAEYQGLNLHELTRMMILDGLAAHAEKLNKRLVGQGLMSKNRPATAD